MMTNQIKSTNQLIKYLSTEQIEDFIITDDPKKEKNKVTKFCNDSIQDNRVVLVIRVKN